jgi:hypothetical protein
MHTFLAALIFSCCISCHSGKLANTVNGSDTTLLQRVVTPVNLGVTPAVVSFRLDEKSRNIFNSNYKTWLLLDDAAVITAPDGVYEIYVTAQPPQINTLNAESPAFVNVLDLYSITAPGAKQAIEVDIQTLINKLFLQKQTPQTVYVTLLFNGNRFANGSKSTKAGLVRFSGMRMLQTKE